VPLADAPHRVNDAHAVGGHELNRPAVGSLAQREQGIDSFVAFVCDFEKHEVRRAGAEALDKASALIEDAGFDSGGL
jgi:hypothetical protein